jgi:glycosyltransferase involved in cell wall biosynthesis
MPRVLVDLLSYTGTKGGTETYARELYRQIGRMDTPFEFVGYASNEFLERDHGWFPGDVVPSGHSGENRFSWAYGELFGVSRAAKRLGADLIHCPAMLGPLKSHVPVVISMHDLLYFAHPEYMLTGLYTEPVKWMEKRAAANAARILTISEASASDIHKYLRFPVEQTDLVPLAGTVQPRERSTVERDRATFLAVGNRRPHKNFDGLVRAVATIDPRQRPKVIITGSHGDDPLLPLVRELGVEDSIELLSWISVEDLDELYSQVTALIVPSHCDGFSLPALEAMMIDLPVMLADIPVYREVGGDAAIYFDATDDRAIGQAMVDAVNHPERLAAAARDGRQRAALFSWEKVAQGTLASFERALAEYKTAR